MTRPVSPGAPPRVADDADLAGCICQDEQLELLKDWQQTRVSTEDIRAAGFGALAEALEKVIHAGA